MNRNPEISPILWAKALREICIEVCEVHTGKPRLVSRLTDEELVVAETKAHNMLTILKSESKRRAKAKGGAA